MDPEKSKQISIFRYGIISDFINRMHSIKGDKERLLKDKTNAVWQIPYSNRKHISRTSIIYWIKRYRESGNKIASLCPKKRSDITQSRVIDNQTAKNLINIAKNSDIKTAKSIYFKINKLYKVYNDRVLSYSAIVRFLHQNDLFNFIKDRRTPPKRATDIFIEYASWMQKLEQGKIRRERLKNELSSKITYEDVEILFNCIKLKPLFLRKRALVILAYYKEIPVNCISKYFLFSNHSILRCLKLFKEGGTTKLLKNERQSLRKYEDPKYINEFFSILHAPPSNYGINRTSWRQADIIDIMKAKGLNINKNYINKIIRNSGYKYKKAKIVLTSNDPDYKEKIDHIKNILSNLGPKEKFFSVDEYGPFAVKMQGGRSLLPPMQIKTVPQWQKNKGSLIITAALELSTNQITHFYSESKNTTEMLKLLEILHDKYQNEKVIYFSWDAASWHASKRFIKKVDEINSKILELKQKGPIIKFAPLPKNAQFMNVIESVFSGMAKAIIHNSDYSSVDECKGAIDRYFYDRNSYFKKNPKKAGNKIWGKEREKAIFSEGSNFKDPLYR